MYAIVVSGCYQCKQPFGYNPNLVPSLTILNGKVVPPGTKDAVREPFCKSCIDKANVKRKADGAQLLTYHPDAYAPIDESELPFED